MPKFPSPNRRILSFPLSPASTDRVHNLLKQLGADRWHRTGAPWATGNVTLFRDQDGTPYAASGRRERLQYTQLEGTFPHCWLIDEFGTGKYGGHQPRLEHLRANTQYGQRLQLSHRVRVDRGTLFYDSCATRGQHIRIEGFDWEFELTGLPQFHALEQRDEPYDPVPGGCLWNLVTSVFGDLEDSLRLLVIAVWTAALDPRVATPWLMPLSAHRDCRELTRNGTKLFIDPSQESEAPPADAEELSTRLKQSRVVTFADVHEWPTSLLEDLATQPITVAPVGDVTDRPWLVVDGIEEPVYPRTFINRVLPIPIGQPALKTLDKADRMIGPELLGAILDTLAQTIHRRIWRATPWFTPEIHETFVNHGHAVCGVLGFSPSVFDEAVCESLSHRRRLCRP